MLRLLFIIPLLFALPVMAAEVCYELSPAQVTRATEATDAYNERTHRSLTPHQFGHYAIRKAVIEEIVRKRQTEDRAAQRSLDQDVQSTWTVCGDGILSPTEQCDDGNTTDGDGCESNCTPTPPPTTTTTTTIP